MDVTRMTRLAHWKLYTLAENYPEYMDLRDRGRSGHLARARGGITGIHVVSGLPLF